MQLMNEYDANRYMRILEKRKDECTTDTPHARGYALAMTFAMDMFAIIFPEFEESKMQHILGEAKRIKNGGE